MPASDMDANYLYIPIWLYSNICLEWCNVITHNTLHSNLVIFKFIPSYSTIKSGNAFTFQSGYIQISLTTIQLDILCVLYIPIWLYSNDMCRFNYIYIHYFTFQSGYIQIYMEKVIDLKSNELYIPIWLYSNRFASSRTAVHCFFTFQSGYIQIKRYALIRCFLISLHSNLVIFKFSFLAYLFATVLSFTFQSGYIQMGDMIEMCHAS